MKEKIRIRKTPYIRWISRISWVLLVIYMVWFVYRWRQLPQTVPLHFGFDGTPDRWGGKESLWMTPALALAVFAGLTVILRFPGIWNTGFKPVTEENRDWVYQNLASMLVSVRLGGGGDPDVQQLERNDGLPDGRLVLADMVCGAFRPCYLFHCPDVQTAGEPGEESQRKVSGKRRSQIRRKKGALRREDGRHQRGQVDMNLLHSRGHEPSGHACMSIWRRCVRWHTFSADRSGTETCREGRCVPAAHG